MTPYRLRVLYEEYFKLQRPRKTPEKKPEPKRGLYSYFTGGH